MELSHLQLPQYCNRREKKEREARSELLGMCEVRRGGPYFRGRGEGGGSSPAKRKDKQGNSWGACAGTAQCLTTRRQTGGYDASIVIKKTSESP